MVSSPRLQGLRGLLPCTASATSHNPDPPPSQSAAAYIEEHNIQKVVEEVINATIKAKPSNPFSFMVR